MLESLRLNLFGSAESAGASDRSGPGLFSFGHKDESPADQFASWLSECAAPAQHASARRSAGSWDLRMSLGRAGDGGTQTLQGGGIALVGRSDHVHQHRITAALGECAAQFDGAQGAATAAAKRSHVGLGAVARRRRNLSQQREIGIDRNVVLEVQAFALSGHRACQAQDRQQEDPVHAVLTAALKAKVGAKS